MKRIPLYLIMLVTAASCTKNAVTNNKADKLDKIDTKKFAAGALADDPTNILAYYDFLQTPVNGMFGMSNYDVVADPLPPATPSRITKDVMDFNGAFYDANSNVIPGGTLTFGKIDFLENPKNGYIYDMSNITRSSAAGPREPVAEYSSVGGTTQTIVVNPVSSTTGTAARTTAAVTTTSLYIPQKMRLNSTQMGHASIGGNYPFFFRALGYGDQYNVSWNADPNNTKGVVISFTYDPEMSKAYAPGSPSTPTTYHTALRVPDNGSYSFTYGDITKLFGTAAAPFNAVVTMTVGRANYAIAESPNGLERYAVYANTAVSAMLYVQVMKYVP